MIENNRNLFKKKKTEFLFRNFYHIASKQNNLNFESGHLNFTFSKFQKKKSACKVKPDLPWLLTNILKIQVATNTHRFHIVLVHLKRKIGRCKTHTKRYDTKYLPKQPFKGLTWKTFNNCFTKLHYIKPISFN